MREVLLRMSHDDADVETTRRALRASALFAECSDDELGRILPLLGERDVPAGTHLVREGEPATELFVIRSGEVDVSKRADAIIAMIPGFLWGWLYARHRTLVAPIVSHALLGWWTLFVLGFDRLLV